MKRRVVNTETYKPERTTPDALAIVDTLECGHEVGNKGSVGFAKHRDCKQCQGWADGTTKSVQIGDKIEKWNPETQMPYWEDAKKISSS